MRNNEELQKGWIEFTNKMPTIISEGSLGSTFMFVRVDELPDGGLVSRMIAYNLSDDTYLAAISHHLQSVSDKIDKGQDVERKHNIGRVRNLFNKLFDAKATVVNRKEMN